MPQAEARATGLSAVFSKKKPFEHSGSGKR
jgi:hypothetical protein